MRNNQFNSLELTLFRAYYRIFNGQIDSKILYYVLLIFEALQINGLIVFNFQLSNLNESTYSNIQSTIKVLRDLSFLQSIDRYDKSDILLYSIMIIMIVFFLYYLVSYYWEVDYKAEKHYFTTILMIFFYLSQMIVFKVFFIPIVSLCFSFIQCKNNSAGNMVFINYPSTSCSSDNKNFQLTLIPSIITFILFSIQSIINSLLFNDNRPLSKVPWSSRNSISPYLLSLLKLVLCFFFIFSFDSFKYTNDIKIFLVLLLTTSIIVVRFFNVVMNHYYVFFLTTVLEGSFVFNSIIAIVNNYANIELFAETFIVQFLSSIFFGLFVFNIIDKMHQVSRDFDTEFIRSETEAYTHISILTDLVKYCKSSVYHKSVFLGIFQKHRLKCENNLCKCNEFTSVLNSDLWEKKDSNNLSDKEVQASTHIPFSFDGYKNPNPSNNIHYNNLYNKSKFLINSNNINQYNLNLDSEDNILLTEESLFESDINLETSNKIIENKSIVSVISLNK